MDTVTQTFEYILTRILPQDAQLQTTEATDATGAINLDVSLQPEYVGQIIGKGGKTIKAIRLLLSLAFPNQRININLPDNLVNVKA